MKSRELSKQVFLSHTRKEKGLAEEIAQILSERGMKVWDDKQLMAGTNWEREINEALEKSDSMIALLGPHSFRSSWIRSELNHAMFDERYKHRLLPVLIGAAQDDVLEQIPWILTKMQSLRLSEEESIKSQATRIADAFVALLKGSAEAK